MSDDTSTKALISALRGHFVMLSDWAVRAFGMEEAWHLMVMMDWFALLYPHADGEVWYFMSYSIFKRKTGFDKRKTKRCIQALREHGVISIRHDEGDTRVYYKLKFDVIRKFIDDHVTAEKMKNSESDDSCTPHEQNAAMGCQNLYGGTKFDPHIYNKEIRKNESKDSYSSSGKPTTKLCIPPLRTNKPKMSADITKLFDHYETLPHVPKLRDRSNGVAKKATAFFQALMDGKVGCYRGVKFSLPKEYCDKYDIPVKPKKLTVDEIMSMMTDAAKIYNPSYEPKNKSYLPKGFADFLYTSYSKRGTGETSWLLRGGYSPPQPVWRSRSQEMIDAQANENVQDMAMGIIDFINRGNKREVDDMLKPTDTKHAIIAATEIVALFDALTFDGNDKLADRFSTDALIEEYIQFVLYPKHRLIYENAHPAFYKPGGKAFDRFVIWFRKNFHYDIEEDEEV